MWQSVMEQNGILISMDGKVPALYNVWIKRFWKSIKYNHMYLNPVEDGRTLKAGIHKYITYYNSKIHHTTWEAPNARYHCSMLKAA